MNTLLNFVFGQSPMVTLAGIIILAIVLIAVAVFYDRRASIRRYLEHRREVRIQRGILMGKKKKAARTAFLKGRWSEAITDFGEKEFFEGRQTREEVNAAYRMFGKTHNMPDIVPVLTPEQVKAAIKYRRAHGIPVLGQEHPAWGESTQTAVSESANVINATGRFGERALKHLKKTA